MDVSELTTEQAKKILAAVESMLGYTRCLTQRMQAVRWSPADSFYVHVHRAHDALARPAHPGALRRLWAE